MSKNLMICPCGKKPKKIFVSPANNGGKWANAMGDCCGEWMIEFRTDYNEIHSEECMELAVAAWNDAPRWNNNEHD